MIFRTPCTAVCVVIGLLSSAPGCSRTPSAEPAARAVAPQSVAVTTVQFQPWARTVRVQGSLLAYDSAVIGSKLAGRVESVDVDLGSVVKRGDALVVLDRRELELRIRLAEAQLEQACAAIALTPNDDETQLKIDSAAPVMLEQALIDEARSAVDRAKPLVSSRAVTGAQVDSLVAQLRAAQARYNSALNMVREQVALIGVRRTELALARQQLDDARVVAPFDGIVEDRRISPGEYVQAGQALVTVIRSNRLRFTAGVPESRAGDVRLGQPVELEIAGVKEPPSASISRVSPMIMQTSRAVRIEADVPNKEGQLQAGVFAEADIVVGADAQTLAVPASAVSRFAGVQKVWRVAAGVATQQTVKTGREEDGRVEILSGLSVGDQIVTNAAEGRDGPVVVLDEPGEKDT